MYPVPATPRAYHPCFTRDIVQAVLVVPQGRAIVNSKPYPACLFLLAGPSVYRCPWGTNINNAASAEKTSPSVSCRKIWCPAPSAQPQAVWGGDFQVWRSRVGVRSRTPETHRVCSHPTANHTKRHVVLLLAEPNRKTLRCQQETVLRCEFS